jgi:hypothetical protein
MRRIGLVFVVSVSLLLVASGAALDVPVVKRNGGTMCTRADGVVDPSDVLISSTSVSAGIQSAGSRERARHVSGIDAYVKVSLLIDYGNGSVNWYERVVLPDGSNVFNATSAIATINYTYWPESDAIIVEAINGVCNNLLYYWDWFYWNFTEAQWFMAPVACNQYVLNRGDIVAWDYQNIESSPSLPPPPLPRTTTVDDDGPADFHTIQEAINAANPGDTIIVASGTYGSVVVNKTVTLLGENRNTTIIESVGAGYVVTVVADNVVVSGFTIRGGDSAIRLINSDSTIIKGNILTSCIGLEQSTDDQIIQNIIMGSSNLYGTGVVLYYSSNNRVSGNLITKFNSGIIIDTSGNVTVVGNTIANNDRGIHLLPIYNPPSGSKFYHNNFINNNEQLYLQVVTVENSWDSGTEGNYWSDYTAQDSDRDGISDSPYIINQWNKDRYPLMGMFSDFNASLECAVQTICNSSISDFQFNDSAISFNVSGENGTTGFCRICIPTALMDGTYKVYVNNTEIPYVLLPFSNSTYSYLYLNYTHSTEEVVITPEIPSLLILPLFMIATLLAVLGIERKCLVDKSKRDLA